MQTIDTRHEDMIVRPLPAVALRRRCQHLMHCAVGTVGSRMWEVAFACVP